MKIVQKIGYLFIAAILTAACSRESNTIKSNPNLASSSNELIAPDNFHWSASFKGAIQVSFTNLHNVSVENEIVHLITESGDLLDKATVVNNQVNFKLTLPEDANYYIYFPNTGDRKQITGGGNMNMTISSNKYQATNFKKSSTSSCTVCSSPFENGDMESPALLRTQSIVNESTVPAWETDASDDKIEIWTDGFYGVPAQEGNQFFEINANQPAALFQSLCLDPGTTVKWSVYHRGRSGVDVAEVRIGASLTTATIQATMSDGTNAWGYYSGSYTVPVGQATTLFIFDAISTAGSQSVGNFIDNFEISCDKDGDGVIDSEDDYPDDNTRAYKSYFPTAGKQVVAFEDLWPSLGDFDFNDLVLSNQVEISKDASNNLVDAKFKVSIDAIGAGIHNAIGLMIYNGSNQAFGSNIISSVSGNATTDAGNTNGIIISDDVFASISQYYQNNGSGPSATPDTLEFTITFNANAGGDFTPELYLFRANDRSHEVHLSGNPQTATLNTNLLGTQDDNGDYKTTNGLPWGIEIITSNTFNNPLEKIDILDAYSQFQQWATSGGSDNNTWYNSPDPEKVFGN